MKAHAHHPNQANTNPFLQAIDTKRNAPLRNDTFTDMSFPVPPQIESRSQFTTPFNQSVSIPMPSFPIRPPPATKNPSVFSPKSKGVSLRIPQSVALEFTPERMACVMLVYASITKKCFKNVYALHVYIYIQCIYAHSHPSTLPSTSSPNRPAKRKLKIYAVAYFLFLTIFAFAPQWMLPGTKYAIWTRVADYLLTVANTYSLYCLQVHTRAQPTGI